MAPGLGDAAGSFPVIAQVAHNGSQWEGGPEGKREGVTLTLEALCGEEGRGQSLRAPSVEVGLWLLDRSSCAHRALGEGGEGPGPWPWGFRVQLVQNSSGS